MSMASADRSNTAAFRQAELEVGSGLDAAYAGDVEERGPRRGAGHSPPLEDRVVEANLVRPPRVEVARQREVGIRLDVLDERPRHSHGAGTTLSPMALHAAAQRGRAVVSSVEVSA